MSRVRGTLRKAPAADRQKTTADNQQIDSHLVAFCCLPSSGVVSSSIATRWVDVVENDRGEEGECWRVMRPCSSKPKGASYSVANIVMQP